MTAALALHVAVCCIVLSGTSSRCVASCRRACRARAFAPHFARHSVLLSDVPLIAPQAADSLRIVVQPIVLSGVFARMQGPCRRAWRARGLCRECRIIRAPWFSFAPAAKLAAALRRQAYQRRARASITCLDGCGPVLYHRATLSAAKANGGQVKASSFAAVAQRASAVNQSSATKGSK